MTSFWRSVRRTLGAVGTVLSVINVCVTVLIGS